MCGSEYVCVSMCVCVYESFFLNVLKYYQAEPKKN